MKAWIRSPKDFWAGAIYVAFGVAAIVLGRDYGMGTATRMGPGYFPIVLGGALALVGVIAAVRSFITKGEPIGTIAYRGLIFVSGGTVLFAALLRGAGLVVALTALVLVSAYASIKFRWGPSIALAAALVVSCVLVFVKGLGVPLPLFGSWFGGG
jgi:hypothetical protein